MIKGRKVFVFLGLPVVLAFLLTALSCERSKSSFKVIGFPQSFADLAEKVKPAVVNISTTSTIKIPGGPFRHFFGPEEGPFGDFFKKFFGDIPGREMKQQSLGSGFIVDKDGYIITNNHVVQGADEIKVKLADGREFKAHVIGRDQKTDLALIKISSLFKDLPALPLGDSDSMRVGDWVLAVGNPFGLGHTVTQGIISATGRVIGSGPYDNFLQTDAPINPGNSGGPLVNLKGEVIGINTAIIASGQGIGFAIPVNVAKVVIPQLRKEGKVVRGWIGVSIQSVTEGIAKSFGLKKPEGALVSDVVTGGPADIAGIKRGDIIVGFDGRDIKKMSDLPFIVAETPVGKTVTVKLIRNAREISLKIRIAEMREEVAYGAATDFGLSAAGITPKWSEAFGLMDKTGVVVTDVQSGSPADEAGIQTGDVIKEINRKEIRDMKDYEKAIGGIDRSQPVLMLIKRGLQTIYVTVSLS